VLSWLVQLWAKHVAAKAQVLRLSTAPQFAISLPRCVRLEVLEQQTTAQQGRAMRVNAEVAPRQQGVLSPADQSSERLFASYARSRTDSDGYGAFSPPSPGTPVTPRLGSGVGPAPGPALVGSSSLAQAGGLLGSATFASAAGFAGGFGAGLNQPAATQGAGSAARPPQVGWHNTTSCLRK